MASSANGWPNTASDALPCASSSPTTTVAPDSTCDSRRNGAAALFSAPQRTAVATPYPTAPEAISVRNPPRYTTTSSSAPTAATPRPAATARRYWRGLPSARAPRSCRAQSGHFCPTGASTAQRGQIGVPHWVQDRRVSTSGWRAQVVAVESMEAQGRRREWPVGGRR
jgi:hypothetical protein